MRLSLDAQHFEHRKALVNHLHARWWSGFRHTYDRRPDMVGWALMVGLRADKRDPLPGFQYVASYARP